MSINSNLEKVSALFKQYDVRGDATFLTPAVAYLVARELAATILGSEGSVALIHDTRLSSPALYKAAYQGLLDGGVTPIPLGLGSTDMLYAACMRWECAGIMLTASHNPAKDNGMKIVREIPKMVGLGSGLEIIRDKVLAKLPDFAEPNTWPEVPTDATAQKELDGYFQKICRQIVPSLPKLKIVADAGNGMGGEAMRRIITPLYPEVEWVDLFWDLDGRFPNHGPDPSKYENLEALQKTVREQKADFGVAYDGDADRAFFVDEQGEIVHADFVSALIAQSLLTKQEAKQPLITPESSSRVFEEVAKEHGSEVIRTPQGHTFVKAAMLEHSGLFGGEYSGHFYFRQFHNMDSGVLAAVILASLLDGQTPLSQRVAQYRQKYFITPSINLLLKPGQNFADIKAKLQEIYAEAAQSELDGLTITCPEWKFNLRSSNTEPKLRLVVECIGEDNLEARLQEVRNYIGL